MSSLRLLRRSANGDIVFREATSTDVPAYAILSHTWGEEEVTLEDMKNGTHKSKAGWKKIQFCAKQAAADGLEYFWIDTCSIDKKNAVELQEAITSMFRWYRNATRCYAYLSDVLSKPEHNPQEAVSNPSWELEFRKSRWHTRGWTLQELIAPSRVGFFNAGGEHLGNKLSLESLIHDITNIPRNALQGAPLSSFSITERKSWAAGRSTTREEDIVYSLQGIFEVSIFINYGEGKDNAARRLDQEIHRSYKGLQFEDFAVHLDVLSMPVAAKLVGRNDTLADMHRLLYDHDSRTTIALHGLGGIGKTQLAVAYSKQQREKYTAILWFNANDYDSLKLGFRDAARQISGRQSSNTRLASVDLEGNVDVLVDAVKSWLDEPTNTRWLVIYDNYDNPKIPSNHDPAAVDLRQYLPRSDHGSVIITSRSAQIGLGEPIHVQKLSSTQQSIEILSNTSGRKHAEKDQSAIALAEELDGFPLALSTAGAYLKQLGTSYADYLQHYKTSWSKLQSTSPMISSYQNRSLYTTWQITYDRIKKHSPASAVLLKLWAYFDRNDVWYGLIRHASAWDNRSIQTLTEDELSFRKAIALLCDFGLVESHHSQEGQYWSGGYSVHTCVHSWMKFVLNQEMDVDFARWSLHCVASEIPYGSERDTGILQRRMLKHAIRQEQLILEAGADYKGMNLEVVNIAHLYASQGKLLDAEALYIRALSGLEKDLAPSDPDVCNTLLSLGHLYATEGRPDEAEEVVNRVLQRCEETRGPENLLTLKALDLLGGTYINQRRFAEAEIVLIQAIHGREKAHGRNHYLTLESIRNLGIVYTNQGKLAKAEEMCTQALQGEVEFHGPMHWAPLYTARSLARVYARQGRQAEAIDTLLWSLQGWENSVGPLHIDTLKTISEIGSLYLDQGQPAEAEAMCIRALHGFETAFGDERIATLESALRLFWNLGDIYALTERKAMARTMYARAYSGFRNLRGLFFKECRELEAELQRLPHASSSSDEGV